MNAEEWQRRADALSKAEELRRRIAGLDSDDHLRARIAELEAERDRLRNENQALRDMIRRARGALEWMEPE